MIEYWATYDPARAKRFLDTVATPHGMSITEETPSGLHNMVNATIEAAELTDEERAVLQERYGLNSDNRPYSVHEVAAMIQKGTVDVRRIEINALGKLQRRHVKDVLERLTAPNPPQYL